MVVPFQNAKFKKVLHKGFSIIYDSDLQGAVDDSCKAWIVEDDKILVKAPPVRNGYVQGNRFIKALKTIKNNDKMLVELHVAAMNEIKENEKASQLYLLVCPSGWNLTNDVYSNGRTNLIKSVYKSFTEIVTSTDNKGNVTEATDLFTFVQWKVTVFQARQRNLERNTRRSTGAILSELTEGIARIAVDEENSGDDDREDMDDDDDDDDDEEDDV